MTELNTAVPQGSPEEHPGLELARVLEGKQLVDSAVADAAGLSRPLLSQITNGNRRITANSATKICRVIGGDPMYWVRRQNEHDMHLRSGQVQAAQDALEEVHGR